ncbi:hypothetical protein A5695_25215 [Mycobacterium sp. E1747]|nr:hypothetical protein A5695_25215 [Mycobacterium sp. E1747]
MNTCTEPLYRIQPELDDHTQRIVAIDPDGVEIAGAYRLIDFNAWHVYVAKLVSDTLGLPQPHKVHACSRADALRWLDLIATLYTKAVS